MPKKKKRRKQEKKQLKRKKAELKKKAKAAKKRAAKTASMKHVTTYYIVSPSSAKVLKKSKITTSTTIGIPEIKETVKEYCQRMKHLENQTNDPRLNLQTETVALFLNKEAILEMLGVQNNSGNANCHGLLGLIGVDKVQGSLKNENQTITLIPCDQDMEATVFGNNTVVLGKERWPDAKTKSLETILKDIDLEVDDYFDDLGIK